MHRFINPFIIATVLISLLITSVFPAELVSASPLLLPDISPTKTDTIINDDGDGKADPGEIIEYTVTIPNSGSDAVGVTFTDIIDANTTLMAGSINVSPVAIADSYETIGNTLLEVGVAAGTDPAIHLTADLFDNDLEFLADAGTFNIISHTNPTNGTLVAFNNGTGTFSYLPNANFTGIDTFTYTLQDAGGLTDTATVSLNVVQRVWYVKNDAAAGGLGRSTDPFDTLAEAQTASSAGDTIYIFAGNGTTTGQNAGIILKNTQRLLGEGTALTVPVSVNGGLNPTTLRVAGSMPLIDNAGGTGIAVSAQDVVNVEIRGLNLAGNTNAVDVTTTAANSGSFELANNIIRSAGQEGVDVNGGGSGTLTVSIHDNTITSTGNGIDIQRTAGSVTVTAFDDNVINGNTGGTGINVVGTGATVLFDAVVGGNFDTVSGGTTIIGQSGNGVGQSGMVLNNVRGDLNFTDLDIYADGGVALSVNGTSSNYTGSSGTRIVVTANVSILSATGGPAASLTDVAMNLVLSGLSSTNSSTTGTSLVRTSGIFSAPVGSSITNATGTDFNIDSDTSTVTYDGTITDTTGRLVSVVNATAGTKSFTGAISDTGSGTSTGISLTGNTGATINFSGGLTLSTAANPAFTATGGGTVNVCDENPCNPAATGVLANTLTTTTATALNVVNTIIGSNDLEFRSISANGATNGIVLNTTGNNGGLTVKGNGTADSGGVIQNTTGAGVLATNTQDLSLTRIKILNAGTHGIDASNLMGTSLVSNSTIQDWALATGNGINLINNNTNLTLLTVSATTFNGTATDNDGIFMEAQGSSSMALSVENGSVFTDMFGDGVQVNGITGATGTVDVTIKNSTFSNAAAVGNGGISLNPFGAVTFNATIDGNTFDTIMRPVTNLGAIGGTNGLTANATIRIKNNALNNIIGSRGITFSSDGTGLSTLLIDNNSINNLGSTSKYAIQVNMIGAVGVSSPGRVTVTNNQIGQAGNLWTSGGGNAEAIYLLTQNSSTMNSLVSGNVVTANANLEVIRARAIGTSAQNFTITNNTVTDSFGTHVGELAAKTESTATLCMNATANTLPGGGAGVISLTESAGTMNITQASSAALSTSNSNATVSIVGTPTFGQPACATPPAITMLPSDDSLVVRNERDVFAKVSTQTTNVDLTVTNAHQSVERTEYSSASVSDVAVENPAANVGGGKPLSLVNRTAPAQSGETINLSIGNLPAGETVTIKFRVTVDNPLPDGKIRILNQGTVSGSNFSTVNTVDPSPDVAAACAGSGTQTCTPVDRPDTSIVSINRAASSPTSAASVSWTVTFANAISSLTSSNFVLVNSGLGGTPIINSVIAVGGAPATEWIVTASTGSGSGTLGLNMVNDTGLSHDVTVLPFTGQVYTIDLVAPTVTINQAGGQVDPTSVSPINFTVVFSEAVTDFDDATDVSLSGTAGATTALITGGPTTYNVAVSGMTGDGTVIASIPAGVASDGVTTNAASTSTDNTVLFDATVPTVTINQAAGQNDPTGNTPINFTVVFSEAVTDFDDAADVTLSGTAGATTTLITGGPTTYNVAVSGMSADGTVIASVPAGVVVDLDSKPNAASTSSDNTVTYDGTVPTVTINQAAGQLDPASSSPINFTVVFSEAVTDFNDTADVTLTGTAGATTTVITGGPTTYNVAVSGMTGAGTVIANIPASVAFDAAANPNTTSTSSDNSVLYSDNIPPVVLSSVLADANPTSLVNVHFTVTFSESVTGVDPSDFSLITSGVSGAAITAVSGSGSVYTVTVNTGNNNGTIHLNVLDDDTIQDALLNPLAGGYTNGETYTIISKAPIFADVPFSYWANSYIERFYNAGITSGCGTNPLIYCPDNPVTRAQMAIFLLRATHGASYAPPPATGTVFGDVPVTHWAAAWIEQLYFEGFTSGCGGGNYCPEQVETTRAQMAIFLLKAKHGTNYVPPAPSGVFGDVPVTYWAAAWIEQLAAEGITSGCGGGNYCPEDSLTRAQMAVFLVRTLNLP